MIMCLKRSRNARLQKKRLQIRLFQPRPEKYCRRMLASSSVASHWLAGDQLGQGVNLAPPRKVADATSPRVCPVQSYSTAQEYGFHNPPSEPVFPQRNICQAISSPIPPRTPTTHRRNLPIRACKRPLTQTIPTASFKQWVSHARRRERSGADRGYDSCLRDPRRDSAC